MASAAAGMPARSSSAAAADRRLRDATRRRAPRRLRPVARARSRNPKPAIGDRAGTTAHSLRHSSSVRDGDADPVVFAGAAVDAVRDVAVGVVPLRLRRGAELRRQQRFGHRPQHRLDHREIDPRHPAGPSPMPQRGGDDKGEHQAAHRVEPGKADPRRRYRDGG